MGRPDEITPAEYFRALASGSGKGMWGSGRGSTGKRAARRSRRGTGAWRTAQAAAEIEWWKPPALDCAEDWFQTKVEAVLTALGWEWYHSHHPLWDRSGWPDLAAGHERLGFFVAELKTETGRLSARQQRWREIFEATRVEYHLWRPRDWLEILRRLGASEAILARARREIVMTAIKSVAVVEVEGTELSTEEQTDVNGKEQGEASRSIPDRPRAARPKKSRQKTRNPPTLPTSRAT